MKQHAGKSFLDLPRELRDIVYKYCYDSRRYIKDPWHDRISGKCTETPGNDQSSFSLNLRLRTGQDDFAHSAGTIANWLPLCYQTHHKASVILYGQLKFEFHVVEGFYRASREYEYCHYRLNECEPCNTEVFPALYNSLVRSILIGQSPRRSRETTTLEEFLPWLHELCEHLVSRFSALTCIEVESCIPFAPENEDWDWEEIRETWLSLWKKDRDENSAGRIGLFDAKLDKLFNKSFPGALVLLPILGALQFEWMNKWDDDAEVVYEKELHETFRKLIGTGTRKPGGS